MINIRQYDVVVVNLDPTIGSEIKKTRPCLVVSPDEINNNLNTIIIAPITSKTKNYPTRIKVSLDNTKSWVAIDQIRTIDKTRIFKKIHTLNSNEIQSVKSIIKETLVD